MKKLIALASSGQTQPKASQGKKVLVGQIADSAASPRPFVEKCVFGGKCLKTCTTCTKSIN